MKNEKKTAQKKTIKWYDVSHLNLLSLVNKGGDLMIEAGNLSRWLDNQGDSLPQSMADSFNLRVTTMIRRGHEMRQKVADKVEREYPQLIQYSLKFNNDFTKVRSFNNKAEYKASQEHDANNKKPKFKSVEEAKEKTEMALQKVMKELKVSKKTRKEMLERFNKLAKSLEEDSISDADWKEETTDMTDDIVEACKLASKGSKAEA